MTALTTEFIVLATTKVGDNALVVHTLSREWGRRGFLVRSAKKTGTTLFLPLNILEADVVENSKSELWTLKNITLKDALPGIRGHLQKNTMTLFLSEVLLRTLRDGANEDGLFDWCVGSILTLNALEADFANFPVRFLMELAGAPGFRPTFDDIAPYADEATAQRQFYGEHAAAPERRHAQRPVRIAAAVSVFPHGFQHPGKIPFRPAGIVPIISYICVLNHTMQ